MNDKGLVLWFTGLSGSGKSTIAARLCKQLRQTNLKIEHLDGDAIREVFPNTGFSKAERDMHIKRVGYMASRLEFHGVTVIATFISPYTETRKFVREMCNNFIEIYVSTPISECEKRDIKGLYSKARSGELKQFTGIDDPYEPPDRPEITIDTTHRSVDDACDIIINYLKERKML